MVAATQASIAELPVDSLRLDGGTQIRAAIDEAYVAELSALLKADRAFELPPVEVVQDGRDYWLVDGFHRALSYEDAGRPFIYVKVTQGTLRDAILLAAGANAMHGKRRTAEDTARAVLTLARDPEWGRWNDSEIARRCHLNPCTVARIRRAHNVEAGAKRLVRHGDEVREMDVTAALNRRTPSGDEAIEAKRQAETARQASARKREERRAKLAREQEERAAKRRAIGQQTSIHFKLTQSLLDKIAAAAKENGVSPGFQAGRDLAKLYGEPDPLRLRNVNHRAARVKAVLALHAEGLNSEEISKRLDIHERSVRRYIAEAKV